MSTQASWHPDPATGLSGDEYLTVALEEFVDDLSDARRAGIYVLELSTPETSDYEEYSRLWLEAFEKAPRYLKSIADRLESLDVTIRLFEGTPDDDSYAEES